MEVHARALNGFILAPDPFSNTDSQPVAARHVGSVGRSVIGDDSQDWAIVKGECASVNSKVQSMIYERCTNNVLYLPYDGFDSIQIKVFMPDGGITAFTLSMGLANDTSTLDALLTMQRLQPAVGPPGGGTTVDITVTDLERFTAAQVLEIICEFGSPSAVMTAIADWTPDSNRIHCVSPPLSRRLVAAPEVGMRGYSEEVPVNLHLKYYVFNEGWKRTDALTFTYRPEIEIIQNQTPPLVRQIFPGVVRIPAKYDLGMPSLPLMLVEMKDLPPESYKKEAFAATAGHHLTRAASKGALRCRLQASVQVAVEASVLQPPLVTTPAAGSEDWPGVLCNGTAAAVKAAVEINGTSWATDALVQISVDAGLSWSQIADPALVTLVGPDAMKVTGLLPKVRLSSAVPANISVLGVGFSLLHSALQRGQNSGAVLECVWLPATASTRLQNLCRTPASIVNDTLISCPEPPSAECMQLRGSASYQVTTMDVHYGIHGAATNLVLPCEVSDDPNSCLHVLVPTPAVQQATYVVPESGGNVTFEVAGLDSAADGLMSLLCRFRHAASILGPMFTKPYVTTGKLQASTVFCTSPDWNTSLAGGFGHDLTHRTDEEWWWLVDLTLDSSTPSWLPSVPAKVNISRWALVDRSEAPPPLKNTTVEEEPEVQSTCWWYNHSSKEIISTTGPLQEVAEALKPSLLVGDGTMVCNSPVGDAGGGLPAWSPIDTRQGGLDLAVATEGSDFIRLQGETVSGTWKVASALDVMEPGQPVPALVPTFAIVPSFMDPEALPEAAILVGYGFSGNRWTCRWTSVNTKGVPFRYFGTVINNTALSCPLPLELNRTAALLGASTRWELQAMVETPSLSTLPLVAEVLPISSKQYPVSPTDWGQGDCLQQTDIYRFRFGPCDRRPVTCAQPACRLTPLMGVEEGDVDAGLGSALRDDLMDVAWTDAEVLSSDMQGEVLCDMESALRRAPVPMAATLNQSRPYLVVAICDGLGRRPPARVARSIWWTPAWSVSWEMPSHKHSVSPRAGLKVAIPDLPLLEMEDDGAGKRPKVWLETPLQVDHAEQYGGLTFSIAAETESSSEHLVGQPATCHLSGDRNVTDAEQDPALVGQPANAGRRLLTATSSISGVMHYDGIVRCDFRLPARSAWAVLYANRSAEIRDSPYPWIRRELEVRPAHHHLYLRISVSGHRTAWSELPFDFLWALAPSYGTSSNASLPVLPSSLQETTPSKETPDASAAPLHADPVVETWDFKDKLVARLSPDWGFTEGNATPVISPTRFVQVVGISWPRSAATICVWARESFEEPDHILAQVAAVAVVSNEDDMVLSQVGCPLPAEVLGAPGLTSIHLGLQHGRTVLPSLPFPLWSRPQFLEVTPRRVSRAGGQTVTLRATGLPPALRARCLLHLQSEDLPVPVEAFVKGSSVVCMLQGVSDTLAKLRGASSQMMGFSVTFHENLEWSVPVPDEMKVEVVDAPEIVNWSPRVAAADSLDSRSELKVLLELAAPAVRTSYLHWYCAWRLREEPDLVFVSTSRLMFFNASFVSCPLNFRNYRNLHEVSGYPSFQLYFALGAVPLAGHQALQSFASRASESLGLAASSVTVHLAGNLKIFGPSPKVQSAEPSMPETDPVIRLTGYGFRGGLLVAVVSKPWLNIEDELTRECRLCSAESQSALLCPYTRAGMPAEANVNVTLFLVDTGMAPRLGCQDGAQVAVQNLTIFRQAVGPFSVHPSHAVPELMMVRFSVHGNYFSPYAAHYCRFRVTAESPAAQVTTPLVQAARLNSTMLLCTLETPKMPDVADTRLSIGSGELMLCIASCTDPGSRETSLVLRSFNVFAQPTLDLATSSLTYVRQVAAEQALLISFQSWNQLPVSLLPCTILTGMPSPFLCEPVREQLFYSSNLRCRVPPQSGAILRQPLLQCAGSQGGFSPVNVSIPIEHLPPPSVIAQSVTDLHVDAPDLIRFRDSLNHRPTSVELVLLSLGLSMIAWEDQPSELVGRAVDGCRLTRSGPVPPGVLKGSRTFADGLVSYLGANANGTNSFVCRFEVSSGIQDIVPWSEQEQPALNLSLHFRSGFFFDTSRSITVHPQISGARALPTACADLHHCSVLVMGSGFTTGAAYTCLFASPGQGERWLVSPAQVLNRSMALCTSPEPQPATSWSATHVSLVQGEVPLPQYGYQDFLQRLTGGFGPAAPILEEPAGVEVRPRAAGSGKLQALTSAEEDRG